MSRVQVSFPAPIYKGSHCFFFLSPREQGKRRYSQVVRPRSAKPSSPGSNPGGASKIPTAKAVGIYFFPFHPSPYDKRDLATYGVKNREEMRRLLNAAKLFYLCGISYYLAKKAEVILPDNFGFFLLSALSFRFIPLSAAPSFYHIPRSR